MVFQFENDFIFPDPSYDLDTSYRPQGLLRKILKSKDAVKGVGKIYVSSVKYCKRNDGAFHEFLAFEVKDSTSADRCNTIIVDRVPLLDRNSDPATHTPNRPDATQVNDPELQAILAANASPPPASPTVRSRGAVMSTVYDIVASSKSELAPYPAFDVCRVSVACNGDYRAHAKRQHLYPFTCIASMEFTGESFTLEKLLVLADTVSKHKPNYHLINAQCYWYALSLWKLVGRQEVHEGGTHNSMDFTDIHPATHPLAPGLEVRFNGNEHQQEIGELIQKYNTEWNKFVEGLSNWQGEDVLPNSHQNDGPGIEASVSEPAKEHN